MAASQTFPQTPIPSPGSNFVPRLKVLVASFGGGYEQRIGEGPTGAVMRDWQLTWDAISRVNAKILNDFLVARGGVDTFFWTQLIPYDVEGPKVYICGEGDFKWSYSGGDTHQFSALFRQRPFF